LRCLDVCAGSGALGFEAASRGASQVVMMENHTPAFKQLETVKKTQCQSGPTFARRCNGSPWQNYMTQNLKL